MELLRTYELDLKSLKWISVCLLLFVLSSPLAVFGDDGSPLPYSTELYGTPKSKLGFSALGAAPAVQFIRKQVMQWEATHYMMGMARDARDGFMNLQNSIGFNDYGWNGMDGVTDELTFFGAPNIATLMRPASNSDVDALWLAPAYHHAKGLMPWHDAMMVNVHYQTSLWNKRAHLQMRPFVGQGVASIGNVWGNEMTLRFGGGDEKTNYGTLVVRYDGGDAAMTENARGYDVHGVWTFDKSLNLNIGSRIRDGENQNHYIMLRWNVNDLLAGGG